MFKKLRWPLMVVIAALTLMAPASAMADRYREHSDHVLVQVDVGHGYWHRYRHCHGGWWDRWGHWHRYRCW
jgi:hypothetical protein